MYYHCTYYRGKCPEPYVREEVLEEKFTDVLRSLHFDAKGLRNDGRNLRYEPRFRKELGEPIFAQAADTDDSAQPGRNE